MNAVTKNVFLNARICITKGWYLRTQAGAPTRSEADQFRMEQGMEIGRQARSMFPSGIHVPPNAVPVAAEKTNALLTDVGTTVLFEAVFFVDGYIAKPDILNRSVDGWQVLEVKSSLEDTDQIDDLIDDLAYTVMVVQRCGVKVSSAGLMLISRGYRKGMGADRLLVTVDQTATVMARVKEFLPLWKSVGDRTSAATRPNPLLIPECKSCEFFADECLGKGIANPVTSLPSLHKNKFAQLSAAGIIDIAHLPGDFVLTENQTRVVDCLRTKKPYVAKALREELDKVIWPAHYLDFETVMTALPLYDDCAPHEQLCTQYSIHHCSAPGKIVGHSEFLADSRRDCQRDLAEQLIRDLGAIGSIIVYSPFEGVRLDALAKRFPDLTEPLKQLKDRLFDLLPIMRRCFYHHDFAGSYSIKSTLPALVPDMSYDGLAIGDGGTAIARFAKLAMARYAPDEAEKVQQELRSYCAQDTLAMVRLHEALLHQC